MTNKARRMANGFAPTEAAAIIGLSVHMLNYLARHAYLKPHYGSAGRGRTRYYSYRDLVVGRIVARLLKAGLEIGRLKVGIAELAKRAEWTSDSPEADLRLLATDGTRLFFLDRDGSVRDLTKDGQLAFAFVLDVQAVRREVMSNLDYDQRQSFTLFNRRLRALQFAR